MKTALFYTALISAAMTAPAFAGPELFIEDFVGTVLVETTPDSTISISREDNMSGVNLYTDGGNLKIDGGIKNPEGNDCKGYYGSFSISLFKKQSDGRVGGYKNLDDFPKLSISAPKDTKLIIRNSIPFLTAGDLGAADLKLSSCGKVDLGHLSDDLMASIRGSADVDMGHVGGNATLEVRGSGDVTMGDAKDLYLKVSGSGDVEAGNVRAGEITVRGSGDVELGNVNGPLGVESSGSSDLDIGDVVGDFIYDGGGSGDLKVNSVSGRISVDINGAGDMSIHDGKATSLKVSASGASEFDFGGVAETADLYASGASHIYVNNVIGDVRSRETGAADIDVN